MARTEPGRSRRQTVPTQYAYAEPEVPEEQGYDMFADDPDTEGLLEAYMNARGMAEISRRRPGA